MQLGRTPQSFLGPVELQELEPSLCDVANVAQQTTARARQQWRCHSIPAANINLAIAAYNRIWDKGSNRSKSRTKERCSLCMGRNWHVCRFNSVSLSCFPCRTGISTYCCLHRALKA